MGAWGAGIYENDDAADWTAELTADGLAAVEAALNAVDGDYVEAPEGAVALAAADVVARLAVGGGETSAYCEGVVAWVNANAAAPAPSLLALVIRAVERVRGDDSELAGLWAESPESFKEWTSVLSELDARLVAALG